MAESADMNKVNSFFMELISMAKDEKRVFSPAFYELAQKVRDEVRGKVVDFQQLSSQEVATFACGFLTATHTK